MKHILLLMTIAMLFLAPQANADYAIFYEHQDLTAIAANVSATLSNNYDQFLTAQERNTAKQTFQKAWNGGLKNWSTAPIAPVEHQEGDPNMRIVVVSGNGVFLQDLRVALYLLAQRVPGAEYMAAIADDLAGASAAVEPWP